MSFKGLSSLIAFLNVATRAFDELKSQLVALLVVIGPVDETVLAHVDALGIGILLADLLEKKTEIKARALPGRVNDFVAKDLFRDCLRIPRRTERDEGIRVHVINMLA